MDKSKFSKLGMNAGISRRDFLNGVSFSAAAMALNPTMSLANANDTTAIRADWYGYGGVGDYSPSHGNTPEVVKTAHMMRDGIFSPLPEDVIDTKETYDLVVVGGGIAGLAACRKFLLEADDKASCLVIENHPVTGGAAKRNEFLVDGVNLAGPQASNASAIPESRDDWYGKLWDDLKLPREYQYQEASGAARELRFAKDNYLYSMLNADELVDTGFFFSGSYTDRPRWVINPAKDDYASLPFTESVNRDLWKLKTGTGPTTIPESGDAWLDSISLSHYMENTLGMSPSITRIYSELIALNCGVGADAVSALVAKKLFVRFFQGFDDCCLPLNADPGKDFNVISFPGGNDTVARHFLKAIRPELISGENTADGIFNGKLNFADFDKPGMRARIRSRSTAVDIRHDGDPSQANTVSITYYQEGKLHRVRAKTVVSAVGAWVNKKIIKDMDEQHRWAFSQPHHGSNLVANVALTNWRPMAKLGITACHYFTDQGLGIYCNIRKPMLVGNYAPPLDPDKPVVLTFYMGFPSSGSAQEQAVRSRTKLLHTGFSTFEFEIRRLLTEMFSDYGFDAKRDVAGIVLNRWGHSYIVPEPGFYFGRDGMPPVSHIMGQAHGRIAFAHSEQAGIQDWHNAAIFGEKAAEHALKIYR